MNLVDGKCPGDAVSSVNPKLIRQEGQSLPSLVTTLGAHGSLPCCGLNRLWSDQNRQNQQASDDGRKPDRREKVHCFLLESGFSVCAPDRIRFFRWLHRASPRPAIVVPQRRRVAGSGVTVVRHSE